VGILLSRFRAVTFPQQRRLITGGLASIEVSSPPLLSAIEQGEGNMGNNTDRDNNHDITNNDDGDGGGGGGGDIDEGKNTTQKRRPYYGLHWRKELNWRAMCFEFIEDDEHHNEQNIIEHPDIERVGDYHA